MDPSATYKCPGCGADITLPDYFKVTGNGEDDARLARLARATCGCWASQLNEDGTTKLVDAMISGHSEEDLPT